MFILKHLPVCLENLWKLHFDCYSVFSIEHLELGKFEINSRQIRSFDIAVSMVPVCPVDLQGNFSAALQMPEELMFWRFIKLFKPQFVAAILVVMNESVYLPVVWG